MRSDATITELQWFFRDSSLDSEIPFMLAAIDLVDEAIPDRSFSVAPITKARAVRNALLSLPQPHADVLSWMFETREYHPRVRTLFSWPGVALRSDMAREALAFEESENVEMTADRPLARWPLTPGNEAASWADAGRTFDYRTVEIVTGDHPSRLGMTGYLINLKPGGETVKAIRDEVSRRVSGALLAYDSAKQSRRYGVAA